MNHQEVELYRPEFTLLVAGSRGGKTSFLRLLLDTSDISSNNSKEQLASVAKFVQGCSGHTTYIKAASVDIDTDAGRSLGLNLIDTPSLDFDDDAAAERVLAEVLRLIDSRFLEGLEDERKAKTGDRYVHLCIYFLDPDHIVPPDAPRPPAPLVPRERTNSFSQPDQEPVILEPPVTNNPLMFRPTLPPADIATIRRLSARVNVLPVIGRADLLSNERLAAVKLAVRRDLADAGIGFGIFDMDNHPPPSAAAAGGASTATATATTNTNNTLYPPSSGGSLVAPLPSSSTAALGHAPDDASKKSIPADSSSGGNNDYGSNGYGNSGGHLNGGSNSSASATTTPPTSPVTPSIMRLPYALVSPDIYSHSEGVPRVPLARHELVQQYTPSQSGGKLARRGNFLRCYRWGNLDILDPAHCDFLPLRNAIFHHMETLQNYTRDYLFDKFRCEYIQLQQQQRPPSRHSLSHPHPHSHHHTHSHSHSVSHPHSISHLTHPHPHSHIGGLGPHPSSRPSLVIDTQPPSQHPPPPPSQVAIQQPQSLPPIGRHPPSHSVPVSLPTSSRDIIGTGDGRTPGTSTSARSAGLSTGGGVPPPTDSPIASASGSGRPGSSRSGTLNSTRIRTKKITVACNFCRSRKLKCDGGKPSCGQCLKRSNQCDYAPQNKRRNTIRQPRRNDVGGSSSRAGEDDEDSATAGDYNRGGDSGNDDNRSEVSLSPETRTMPLATPGPVSAPISRRSSNVDKREREGYASHHSLPPILSSRDRDELPPGPSTRAPQPQPPPPPHPLHHLAERDPHPHLRDREAVAVHHNPPPPPPPLPSHGHSSHNQSRTLFPDNELPHIATLSLPPEHSSPSTPAPMSAPSLPPIRPASEQQAALRKRAATVPGKNGGRGSGSGPKVVACNSCRARKTKCDGAHPSCASCSRRQVHCVYAQDVNANAAAANRDPNAPATTKKRRASTSAQRLQQQQQQQLQQQRQHHPHQQQQQQQQRQQYLAKEGDASSRSVSPPSSRMIQTPSTAGTGPGDVLIDRHGHHHHPYSFRELGGGRGLDRVKEDDLDQRGDRVRISERDREREIDVDLKRPLPLDHLDRDAELRGHDDLEMRAVKKMRIEDSRPVATSVGGMP